MIRVTYTDGTSLYPIQSWDIDAEGWQITEEWVLFTKLDGTFVAAIPQSRVIKLESYEREGFA